MEILENLNIYKILKNLFHILLVFPTWWVHTNMYRTWYPSKGDMKTSVCDLITMCLRIICGGHGVQRIRRREDGMRRRRCTLEL